MDDRLSGPSAIAGSGMFVRKSSGLVRTVTTLDTFFYCLLQLSLPFLMFNFSVFAFYPGASMEWAAVIALAGSLCLGVTYALFSTVYPRSGGEYVFLSRTAHPLIGFMMSFGMSFWELYYFGLDGALAASIGLAPLFAILGLQTGNQTILAIGKAFDSPWGWFLTAFVIIAFFTVQLYRGMATYFRWQKYATYIALVCVVIFVLVLVGGSIGVFHFNTNFDALTGAGAYDKLISDAQAQGVDLTPSFSLGQTANFIIWPAFMFLFAVLSVSFSGEIKNVRRGQLYAIVAANIVGGLLVIVITFFARHAIGDQFLRAASGLGSIPGLPYPWLTLLTSILGGNALLTFIVGLTFVILLIFAGGVCTIYATRGMLAWALDGMTPGKLGEVSDKYHTPTYTIIVSSVIALILVGIYSFTTWLRLLSGIASMGMVFVFVSFFGMLFPYIKREAYLTSPAKIEVAGIPLMSITGFLGFITSVFVVYRGFVDTTYAANSTLSIIMFFVVFGAGAIWYFVAKWVRAREGVDLDSRFKEIPIE